MKTVTGLAQLLSLFTLIQVSIISHADEVLNLSWHFNHTQDTFAIAVEDGDTDIRTTGLSTFGFTLQNHTGLLSISVDGQWINRDDPFTPLSNDFNGLSNITGEKAIRLFHAVLNIGDPDSSWSGSIGQQVIDDNFLVIHEANQLINSAFGMASVITGNTPSPTFPLSSLGIHLRYQNVSSGFNASVGLFDGSSGDEMSNTHGTVIDLNQKEGILLISEIGWSFPGGRENPGQLKIGAWHHSGEFLDRRSNTVKHHNSALYAILEGRFSLNEKQFGYFARLSQMRVTERSLVSRAFEAGINWYGLLTARPDDPLSFGLIWTRFSEASVNFPGQSNIQCVHQQEWGMELTYKYHVNDWLSIQPDVQWLVNPHGAEGDALVAGARIIINF